MKAIVLLATIIGCVCAQSKIKVEFFVESHCPDCIMYDRTVVLPFLKNKEVMKFVDAKVIPFGKAKVVSENPLLFECQHGEKECYGNMVDLCSLKHQPSLGIDMMVCMGDLLKYDDEAVEKCGALLGIVVEDILACVHGEEGPQLMLQSSKDTPTLQYVPSVRVADTLHVSPENLVELVCMEFKGAKPVACRAIPFEKYRMQKRYYRTNSDLREMVKPLEQQHIVIQRQKEIDQLRAKIVNQK